MLNSFSFDNHNNSNENISYNILFTLFPSDKHTTSYELLFSNVFIYFFVYLNAYRNCIYLIDNLSNSDDVLGDGVANDDNDDNYAE